jgi:hypothetical protein
VAEALIEYVDTQDFCPPPYFEEDLFSLVPPPHRWANATPAKKAHVGRTTGLLVRTDLESLIRFPPPLPVSCLPSQLSCLVR